MRVQRFQAYMAALRRTIFLIGHLKREETIILQMCFSSVCVCVAKYVLQLSQIIDLDHTSQLNTYTHKTRLRDHRVQESLNVG